MIPSYFPCPLLIVYITGVLQILGAVDWCSRNSAGSLAFVLLRSSLGYSSPTSTLHKRVSPCAANHQLRVGCVPRCRFCLLRFSGGQLVPERQRRSSGMNSSWLPRPNVCPAALVLYFRRIRLPFVDFFDCESRCLQVAPNLGWLKIEKVHTDRAIPQLVIVCDCISDVKSE